MRNYTDYLIEAYLLEWSDKQVQAFKDKFGEKNFELFDKAKDRLKNKGYSTDIQYYLSNKFNAEDLQPLLLSLYDDKKDAQKKRIIAGTEHEVRGNYKFLGEVDGYLVYQPLDYLASMDLGVNTGWCTTGRYKHYGHPEFTPSENDAKVHFDNYTEHGIKLYYFLNPTTFYGEYALALSSKTINVDKVVKISDENNKLQPIWVDSTNYELFNAKDTSIIYNTKIASICKKLGIALDIKYKEVELINDLCIYENTVIKLVNDNATNIVIPDGVTSIGDSAFYCSNLKSITIPESVTNIDNCAFGYCKSLKAITIPNSVTTIGQGAFNDCRSLKAITIPNSVTTIDKYTFYACDELASVIIPDSITNIGSNAFANCSSLTSVTIPNSVAFIDYNAFWNCTGLKSVTIGNNVKSIGKAAFSNCTSLTSITLGDSVESIGANAFADCIDLKSATIGNNVKSIDIAAFCGCTNLTSITLGNSLECIEGAAFTSCTGLTSITIPSSVTSLKQKVFNKCTSLNKIYYSGNNKDIRLKLAQYADVIDPETGEVIQPKIIK